MDTNIPLNILEQQLTRVYTQVSLCYPLVDDAQRSRIIEVLNNGLQRLSENFPWIAGQVVNDGAGKHSTGVFSIQPLEKQPQLTVKDHSEDPSAPTWEALKNADFPFRLLDENVIAPRNAIPGTERMPLSGQDAVMPVFLVQANFVIGGLILTFNGQHQAMDMTGQGFLIDMLSKACKGESFTSRQLSEYNPDRRNVIALYEDQCQSISRLGRHLAKPYQTPSPQLQDTEHVETPSCTWEYFLFNRVALDAIKDSATRSRAPDCDWISTDDALSAFMWQSVQRARKHRIGVRKAITLARAVDVRRHLHVSLHYPGVMLNVAFYDMDMKDLLELPLGKIASYLRRGVDPEVCKLEQNTRALATALDSTPDKKTFDWMSNMDFGSDLFISSWSRLNLYELDFGLQLGQPVAVRRPATIAFQGLIYLMPKRLEGQIAVGVCLRDDDLEKLNIDQDFIKYTTPIH